VSGFGSTQRLPGIGQEEPAPKELADRWHSVARRVRWWYGNVVHLRSVLVTMLFGVVCARIVLYVALVIGCGAYVVSPLTRRIVTHEARHLSCLWWRYRWSSNASRVGLGADGESSVFDVPELRSVRVDPLGRTYRLRVSRLKLAEVESSAERLRAKWKAHHVLVTVPRPGFIDLRVLKADPLATIIPYRPGRPVATLQDGQPFQWSVGGGHALIAGTTGSGKSGVLAAIVASFAHREDVALLAIDLKRVEVAAIRPRCSKVAVTLTDSHSLLVWLVETMESRWQTMAIEGTRSWLASSLRPWLVLIIDEFAAVAAIDPLHPDPKQAAADARQRLGLIDALTARGRAAGIELLICTQSPTADLFGKTAIRSNLPRRAVARVVSADQAYVGLGVHGAGAELIDASRPGTVKLIVPGLDGITTARFAYLTDTEVESMATQTAHLAPNLEPSDAIISPRANPTSEDSHNQRAGATGQPSDIHSSPWPDPLALIPVSDADLLDYLRVPEEDQPLHMQLLTESSGQPVETLIGRIAVLVNPSQAHGENARPNFSHLPLDSGTPGPRPTVPTESLTLPYNDPRRINPRTGRPFPAPYRKRWSDGTVRNYPEPAITLEVTDKPPDLAACDPERAT
jgi:DNA segregation ATPase FtsK/SpoIIIE, S-DNA-T family